MNEQRTSGRKPIGNFFIKRSMQVELIGRIVAAMVVSAVLSACIIVSVYYLEHRSILLYQLHESGSLTKQSIFNFILPSLLISIVINIAIAFFVGMYASRKSAVPVYKLEQWAQRLKEGKFNTRLRFREQRVMSDLSIQFNDLTDSMRALLTDTRSFLETMTPTDKDAERLKKIRTMFATLDLSTNQTVTLETQPGGR
jgi:methyl-accepting chemotaxis protein